MPTDKGFTLIELLVVISIIAILAVVGVTVFSGVQNSARINSTKEELSNRIPTLKHGAFTPTS